jgi:hypothetical protein
MFDEVAAELVLGGLNHQLDDLVEVEGAELEDPQNARESQRMYAVRVKDHFSAAREE